MSIRIGIFRNPSLPFRSTPTQPSCTSTMTPSILMILSPYFSSIRHYHLLIILFFSLLAHRQRLFVCDKVNLFSCRFLDQLDVVSLDVRIPFFSAGFTSSPDIAAFSNCNRTYSSSLQRVLHASTSFSIPDSDLLLSTMFVIYGFPTTSAPCTAQKDNPTTGMPLLPICS